MNRVQTTKTLIAVAVALLSAHTNAQVGSTPNASAGVSTFNLADFSSTNITNTDATLAQISSAPPPGAGSTSIFGYAGTASADFQTLRAETSGSSPLQKYGTAAVTTSFTSNVMPTQGATGTMVQLNIDLKFDGLAQAGFGSEVGSASAGANLKYQIFDLDSSGYIHDNMPLFQFELNAKAETYRNDVNSPLVTWSRSYASVVGLNAPWNWSGSVNDYSDTANRADSLINVDTGVLSFSSTVLAGHRLVAKGTLESFVSGSGAWLSSSKFGNTFDAELNVDGVALQGNTPGVYAAVQAVPEPDTYALMLAGLVGVAWTARRRQVR